MIRRHLAKRQRSEKKRREGRSIWGKKRMCRDYRISSPEKNVAIADIVFALPFNIIYDKDVHNQHKNKQAAKLYFRLNFSKQKT